GRTNKRGQFVLPVSPPKQNADALFEQAQAAEETGDVAEAERLYRRRPVFRGSLVQSFRPAGRAGPVRSRNQLSARCAPSHAGLCRRDVQSCAVATARQQARRGGGVLAALSRQGRQI